MERTSLDFMSSLAAPVHRSLSEPILLGGAPRAIAILNGTLPPHLDWDFVFGSQALCFG